MKHLRLASEAMTGCAVCGFPRLCICRLAQPIPLAAAGSGVPARSFHPWPGAGSASKRG